jgi:hypothetical protein
MKGEPRVIDHTVRLPRGVLVTGRVIEEETGKGIAGADLEYFSTAINRELPRPFAYRTRTDAEGHLRVAVPPGEGNLVLLTVPPGYLGHGLESGKSLRDAPPTHLRSFDVSVQKKPPPLEFMVSRGIEVVGQVIGPDGTAAQVTRIEELDLNPDRHVAWTAQPTGEIRLRGLSPETPYQFAMIAQKLGLATVVELTTPQAGAEVPALRIKLEPLASMSGRVIDETGKPIADVVVRLSKWTRNRLQGGNAGSVIREPIATKADGTFLWKELVPGVEYSVHASANGYKSSHSDLWKAPGPQNLRVVLKAE